MKEFYSTTMLTPTTGRKAGALAAVVVTLALSGCGGEKASGPAAASASFFSPSRIPPPVPANPALFPKVFTAEYFGSYALNAVNAGNAYIAGLTGRGVTVAVVDSGIADIAKLQGQIAATVNVTGAPLIQDDHGTSVAAVLAAISNGFYIHGIAYGAHVADIKIGSENSFLISNLDNGLQAAAGQNKSFGRVSASIVNLSLGGDAPISPDLRAALDAVVNAGKVIVIAAGNNTGPVIAGANPSPLALFAIDPDAKGQVIIAGASTQAGAIASFSDRAGSGKAFYLLAPGDQIPTLGATGAPITQSGTSFSAPIISGAAAILEQEFPNLKAAQVVQILLKTADPIPGETSAEFGAGILDLAKAIQPIGPLAIPTGRIAAGPALPLGPFQIQTGMAFGAAAPSGLTGRHVLAVDSFQRGYLVALPDAVRGAQDRPEFVHDFADNTLARSAAAIMLDDIDHEPDRARPIEFLSSPGNAHKPAGMDVALLAGGGTVVEIAGHVSALTMASAAMPDVLAAGRDGTPLFAGGDESVLPQAHFVEDGYGAALARRIGDFKVSASAVSSTGEFDPATGRFRTGRNSLAEFGAETRVLGVDIGAEVAKLSENGRMLGAISSGALSFGSGAETTFATVSATARISESMAVTAAYTQGSTRPSGRSAGLFTSVGAIASDAFAVGVTMRDTFEAGDLIGFQIAQPLRVNKARTDLSLPTALTADGDVVRGTSRVDLAPRGREIDLQLAYRVRLANLVRGIDPTALLHAFVMARLDPAHDATAAADYAAGLRVSFGF